MKSNLGKLKYIQDRYWIETIEPYAGIIVRKWTKEEMNNHNPNTPIFETHVYTERHGIKELIYGKLICLEVQIHEYEGVEYPKFVLYK